MKLKHLIQNHHWLSIRQILIDIDPEHGQFEDKYEEVFLTLNNLKSEESNIILMIDRHWEDGKPTNHAHAYGYDPTISEAEPTPYLALEWTSWSKWLGFEIDRETIEEWTELEIICHSILEMTLDGFNEQKIHQTSSQLISQVNGIKSEFFKNKLDNK